MGNTRYCTEDERVCIKPIITLILILLQLVEN